MSNVEWGMGNGPPPKHKPPSPVKPLALLNAGDVDTTAARAEEREVTSTAGNFFLLGKGLFDWKARVS